MTERPRPKTFYTVDDVADSLSVSPRSVHRWIDSKELIAHRFGRAVRVAESDLVAFLDAHQKGWTS
jgi:excisionase family DNA binding protein